MSSHLFTGVRFREVALAAALAVIAATAAQAQTPTFHLVHTPPLSGGGLGVFDAGDLTDGVLQTTPSSSSTAVCSTEVAVRGAGNAPRADIIINLGSVQTVTGLVLGTHINAGSNNNAPDDVTVSFSTTGIAVADFTGATFFNLEAAYGPLANGHHNMAVPITATSARYVKLGFNGGSMREPLGADPNEKWMLDEVSIYSGATNIALGRTYAWYFTIPGQLSGATRFYYDGTCAPGRVTDSDGDGVPNSQDVCDGGNDTMDADADLIPDFCDPCPLDAQNDADGDGVCGDLDVCPGGDDNVDTDGDAVPDFCDECPLIPDNDSDGDGIANCHDVCPNDAQNDGDGDGFCGDVDICSGGDDRVDTDEDLTPDFCDACPNDAANDADGDDVCGDLDVCPGGDDHADADGDTVPDFCDSCAGGDDRVDTDLDAIADFCDACPNDAANDADGDSVCGDVDICPGGDDNVDSDGDGVPDFCDPCPLDAQNDADGDGVCGDVDVCAGGNDNQNADGDALPDFCDVCPLDAQNDADGDGLCESDDNCPSVANPSQSDLDSDNVGDACDDDIDGDGVLNPSDNCVFDVNPGQQDFDGDGAGNACDTDVDGDGVVDATDACVPTPVGETVNAAGCSIDELCPCAHPTGGDRWKNHGAYVSCVAHQANAFVSLGLITQTEKDAIVSAAGLSSCGHKGQ